MVWELLNDRRPGWILEDVADGVVAVTAPHGGDDGLRHLVVDPVSHQVHFGVDVVIDSDNILTDVGGLLGRRNVLRVVSRSSIGLGDIASAHEENRVRVEQVGRNYVSRKRLARREAVLRIDRQFCRISGHWYHGRGLVPRRIDQIRTRGREIRCGNRVLGTGVDSIHETAPFLIHEEEGSAFALRRICRG